MRTLILAAFGAATALVGCDAQQRAPDVGLAPVAQSAPPAPAVAEPALDRRLEPELHFQAPPPPVQDSGFDAQASSPLRHVRPEPAAQGGVPATHVHNNAPPVRPAIHEDATSSPPMPASQQKKDPGEQKP